jgi:hypothetical protein
MSLAAFRAELRSAVRDANEAAPPAKPSPAPAVKLVSPAKLEAPVKPKRAVVRLWLPLTPLWVILAPFALVFCPLILLAPEARGMNPFRAAFAIGAVLFALSGTVVDVDAPDALVRIRIY